MSAPASPRCRHEWSPDYVCTKCARVRLAAEPYWARVTKWGAKRGARPVWLALWTCADSDTTEPRPVYPGNKLLCERTGGLSKRSVQARLVELQEVGWIRAVDGDHGRSFELAWMKPRADWGAAFRMMCAESCTVRDSTPTAQKLAPPAQDSTPNRAGFNTHTFVDLGVGLPADLGGDAGARPDTPSDNPAPEEHTHDHDELSTRRGARAPRQDSARTHTREPSSPPMAELRAPGIEPSNDAATPRAEHTHGDTRPDQPASADDARTRHRDEAPGAGRSLADHAAAIRARPPDPNPGGQLVVTGKPRRRSGDPGARGDDSRGAGDHRGRGDSAADGGQVRGMPDRVRPASQPMPKASARLSQELVKAVAAAGDAWSVRLGEVRFEQDVRACVDDIGLTPEELTRALKAWETWDRAERPNRREVLWGRAASRAWVRKAARIGVSLYAVPAPAIVDDPWAVGS